MGLQVKMWLLMALMFSILYGVITGIGSWMGAGNALFYLILAFLFIGFQYLIGPSLVQLMMRVKWVSEREEPELHQMVYSSAQLRRDPQVKQELKRMEGIKAFFLINAWPSSSIASFLPPR